MTLVWWFVYFLVGVLVITGKGHRWLRAHGLGRHAAALAQAAALAGAFVAMWGSFAPTPPRDLLIMFSYMSLLMYGSVLLWLRWRRLS